MMKTIFNTAVLVILLMAGSCVRQEPARVITVRGPVPARVMGTTLVHEHILVDFIGADSTGPQRWDREKVVEKALPFLEEAISLGLQTFVDATPPWLGRDPELLRMLARMTGLNILTPTGLYGAYGNRYVPRKAFEMSPEELASGWIAEFRNGIGESGIRPGFIKIAVDTAAVLSPMHEKIVRAAAITHLATGMEIMSHTGPDGPAFAQLAILEEMGVPPDAFIWTHAQLGSKEGRIRAAEMGAWISLDNVSTERLDAYLAYLKEMKAAGRLDRVLISHDSGWYSAGEPDGGNFKGYTVIFSEFIPLLRRNGFSDSEIIQLMVENPAQAFALKDVRQIKHS